MTASIYNAAKFYTDAVETGASIAYHGADATVSCLEGIVSTTATGWNQGLAASAKACAKWSLGVSDYKKALEAFRKKPPVPVPHGNGAVIYDMRPIGKRVGEFTGHMINGGCKAVASTVFGVGTAAYIGGNISNAMSWDPSYQFGDFHTASRMLADGVNAVLKCVGSVGLVVGKAGAQVAGAAASTVYNHPGAVFNTTGMGAALYFTSCQIVKAGDAESYIRKAGHCALATLGVGAAVLVPVMNPFSS